MSDSSPQPLPAAESIGVSRVLGLWGAISVGARIAIGLSLYAASRILIETAGWAAPVTYGLAALLLLPIVLAYLETAGAMSGNASPYSFVRIGGVRPPLFFVGWLLIGGSLSITAFCAWAISVRIDFVARGILGFAIPQWVVVAGVVAILFVYEVIASSGAAKPRGLVVSITVLAVLASMAWLATLEPTGEFVAEDLDPGKHWLTGVAIFASVLWAVGRDSQPG